MAGFVAKSRHWVKFLMVLRDDSCKATVSSEALLLFKKFPKRGLGQRPEVFLSPPRSKARFFLRKILTLRGRDGIIENRNVPSDDNKKAER